MIHYPRKASVPFHHATRDHDFVNWEVTYFKSELSVLLRLVECRDKSSIYVQGENRRIFFPVIAPS